jgi:hypothetical protein
VCEPTMLSHAFSFCKRARLNAQENQFNGAQGALGGDLKFQKCEAQGTGRKAEYTFEDEASLRAE